MSTMNGISNDCNTTAPYNTTNGGYHSNTNLPTTLDSYAGETILANHAANLQYYMSCPQYQFTQPPPPPPPPPPMLSLQSAALQPPPPPPPPIPTSLPQQQQQQQQYYNNYRQSEQFTTDNPTPYIQYNPGIPPPTMINTSNNYDRRAYYQRTVRGGRGGHNERRKNRFKGVGNSTINNAINNNSNNNNNSSGGGGGGVATKSATAADDAKGKIHMLKRKTRKPMSMDKPNRKWDLEDAKMVLAVEQQHVYKKQLKITFPDEEVNNELVKSYSSMIDYVYFPERSAERYCFLKLNADADVDEEIKRISSIKFGTSFLKAERKYPSSKKTENSPEDIDPYTLYFGNLPLNISAAVLKKLFPTANIDIGRPDPKKSKRTRYARIRYDNVEDAIKAYKKVYNISIGSRTVNVRFYRRKGVNAGGTTATSAAAAAAGTPSEQNTATRTANNLTNNNNNNNNDNEHFVENDLSLIVNPIKTETTDNNDLSNHLNNNYDIPTIITEIKKEPNEDESELTDFSVSSCDEENNSDYFYYEDEHLSELEMSAASSAPDAKLVENDFIKQEASP